MSFTHRDVCKPIVEAFIKDNLPAEKKTGQVLELGPWKDKEFRILFEQNGFMYEAIDQVPIEGSEYHQGKMEDLSIFRDDFYDIIFACHSFEHCERPTDALREMRRVLKPGGKIFLVTPWPCKHHILDKDLDHINVLNWMQLTRLCIYVGFSKVQTMEQKQVELREQDWNVFTMATK